MPIATIGKQYIGGVWKNALDGKLHLDKVRSLFVF
jgi:hypothetical protein